MDRSKARYIWHRIRSTAHSSVRALAIITNSVTLLLLVLYIFSGEVVEKLFNLVGFPETKLNPIMALLVFAVMTILERTFAIEDLLQGKHAFSIGPQDALYRDVINKIANQTISPGKVLFLQHSAAVAVNDVATLCRSRKGMKVVLYQQSPHCPSLESSGQPSKYLAKATEKVNDLVSLDKAEPFRSPLTIKRFKCPASMRALVVDDTTIVLSWYLHLKNAPEWQVIGSECMGIYITKSAPEFDSIYRMICRLTKAYDGECKGNKRALSDNVTLQDCVST